MTESNNYTLSGSKLADTTLTVEGNRQGSINPTPTEHVSIAMFRMDIFRVLLAILGSVLVWKYNLSTSIPYLIVILVLVVISGFPIFIEALENVKTRHMTMELSMTIAIIAALYIEEIFTALIIIAFVLVAEMLEELTVERGRRAVADILQYLPQTITIIVNNEDKVIPIQDLQINDIVLLKPGIRIPVDGSVVFGHSFVDQSVITGESLPVEKLPGTKVFAGSINQMGTLQVKTERIGANTVFGTIIEEVEKANKSQAPIQKTADRLAGYLVYVALSAAFITYLFTVNIRSAISVIIVAGACGIAAGTPLAILGALGQATMMGAIIKGGIYLEKLAEVDTVILDKTGTLTLGRPEVTAIHCQPKITAQELLFTAACVERVSEHPIAQAILQKAKDMNITIQTVDEFYNQPGKGVRATMDKKVFVVGSKEWLIECGILVNPSFLAHNSEVFVGCDGIFLGSIEIADTLRKEAYNVIQSLHTMHMYTILLSGDDPVIANTIGTALGVDEIQSGLLPAEKATWVEKYKHSGHQIAMVGDGVNDALAIKTAHVGIAMGSGTDITKETADVILIGNDLQKMVELLKLAHRTKHTIMENFYGTLLVDGIGMFLAGLGLLMPIFAAFVHVTSELVFILNSARIIPLRKVKNHHDQSVKPMDQKIPALVPKSIHDLSSS